MEVDNADWTCSKCKNVNRSFRKLCNRKGCNYAKDPYNRGFKKGDWLCPLCVAHNYTRNIVCRRCNLLRTKINLTLDYSHGDWICRKCFRQWLKKYTKCRNCGTENVKKSTDPECVVCLDSDLVLTFIHNDTAHRVCCYQCVRKLMDGDDWSSPKCPVCRRVIEDILVSCPDCIRKDRESKDDTIHWCDKCVRVTRSSDDNSY